MAHYTGNLRNLRSVFDFDCIEKDGYRVTNKKTSEALERSSHWEIWEDDSGIWDGDRATRRVFVVAYAGRSDDFRFVLKTMEYSKPYAAKVGKLHKLVATRTSASHLRKNGWKRLIGSSWKSSYDSPSAYREEYLK